jgi:hypothetical protein
MPTQIFLRATLTKTGSLGTIREQMTLWKLATRHVFVFESSRPGRPLPYAVPLPSLSSRKHSDARERVQWGTLFHDGKKLRVDITFNYVEAARQPTAGSSKRGGKRGSSSATQGMLNDLATERRPEEESNGQVSAWTQVYKLLRCSGPPCHGSDFLLWHWT